MAVKPREDWSVAYRRRVERAEALGKSRQAARGHRAREHVTRVPRGAFGTKQKQVIKRFAIMQAARMGEEPDDLYELMVGHAEVIGFEQFQVIIDQQRKERRWYLRAVKSKSYVSRGIPYMIDIAQRTQADDYQWLYYH